MHILTLDEKLRKMVSIYQENNAQKINITINGNCNPILISENIQYLISSAVVVLQITVLRKLYNLIHDTHQS